MQGAPVLQFLRHRWLVLALGLLLSIAIASKIGGGPDETRAVAKGQVLLDTYRSQLADVRPALAATMPWRATLLGKLMETEAGKQRIAAQMGIPVEQLAIVDSELALPPVPASLPKAATEAANVDAPYVLGLNSDGIVPLITITAQAPGPEGAAQLARAAADVLRATAAPGDASEPDFSVKRVTPTETRSIVAGADRKQIVAIALTLFGLWCAGVALAPVLAGAMRSVGSRSAPRTAK